MNIVVIGTGMYSTGRGTSAYGTILPAILEWERDNNNLGKTFFVGTNGNNSRDLRIKSDNLITIQPLSSLVTLVR